MDDLKTAMLAGMKSSIDYLIRRFQHAGVFTLVARREDALLVRLNGADHLTHVKLMSPTVDEINYEHEIAERFESRQPRCVIGSLNGIDLTEETKTAFEAGLATWHLIAPGVPITRIAETVIAMDWGMRVHGVYPSL